MEIIKKLLSRISFYNPFLTPRERAWGRYIRACEEVTESESEFKKLCP